jgi:hypothetical protein
VRAAGGRRSRRFWVLVAAIAATLCLIGACVVMLTATASSTDARLDLNGSPVQLDPGTAPSPDVEARMDVTEDTGTWFAVPSVDLKVPLGAMNEVDNTITPPGFTSAYVVRNMGATIDSPDDGTLYVVMHALRGGGVGPGNFLADASTQTSAVEPGETITVGTLTYEVTSSKSVSKKALPDDATVWANTPGQLVVITCLEPADGGPSTENLVIFATRQT